MTQITNLTKKLIEFESTADNPKQLIDCIDYIASLFAKIEHLHIKKYKKNNKPSLVISTHPQNNSVANNSKQKSSLNTPNKDSQTNQKRVFDVILSGHIDVVPAQKSAFTPKQKKGRIYGRGASDMKAMVAAMIDIMQKITSWEKYPSTALIITSDEEIGGFDGVDYLLNEIGYNSQIAFVPDGADNWHIYTDEKAVFHITFSAKGKSAHGSRIWLGDNANDKLINIYTSIKKDFFKKWGKATINDKWKPTLNLGMFNGGRATNTVSPKASMKLDIRFPSSVKKCEIIKILDKHSNKAPQVTWKEDVYGNANHISPENPFIQSWVKLLRNNISKSNLPSDSIFKKSCAASDARFYCQNNIPTLISKPICSKVHITNEWIDISNLKKFRELMEKWIKNCIDLCSDKGIDKKGDV
jgi:succinyl-diaminopimelate desuccinylase